MKRILLAIVVCIYLHYLPINQITTPEQINIKDTSKSEKPSQVSPQVKKPRKVKKKLPVAAPVVIETCEAAYPLLARYFGDDIEIAKAVMQAESGCVSWIDNSGLNTDGTNDVGLMQINSVHCPHLIACEDRTDPEKNLKAARQIYEGSGWSAWSAYNNGGYLQYLN